MVLQRDQLARLRGSKVTRKIPAIPGAVEPMPGEARKRAACDKQADLRGMQRRRLHSIESVHSTAKVNEASFSRERWVMVSHP